MKNIFLLFFLIMGSWAMAQTLPLDFESPEDANWNGFNGTVASATQDPDDANNTVLRLVGATADFDGASINMATYVDLSDDANNTITFDMYLPLDGSSSNEHLLKFEGGSNPPAEQSFQTSGIGWQQVSVDFPAGFGADYPIMVIFTDAGVGNTGTGTYYFDNIDGPNGDVVPVDPVPNEEAPIPVTPDDQVLSVYGDNGYTNVWTRDYDFGTNGGEINLADAGVNNALKMDFRVAGYGQGTNEVVDITAYETLHIDYWADANSPDFIFTLISNDEGGNGVTEHNFRIANVPEADAQIVNESWQSLEIPLSFFEDLGFSKENFFQWKVDVSVAGISEVVYFDNIYFSSTESATLETRLASIEVEGMVIDGFDPDVFQYIYEIDPAVPMPQITAAIPVDTTSIVLIDQAPEFPGVAIIDVITVGENGSETGVYTVEFVASMTPTDAAPDPTIPSERVISLYSDVYDDVNVDTWNTTWSDASYSEVQIAGNATHRYDNLVFNGVETTSMPVDASDMEFFHIDLWSANIDSVELKIVDFLGDGFAGENGDVEGIVYAVLEAGSWNSFMIPLSDFEAAGLSAQSDLNQYIFTSFPNGGTLFVDNVYFSRMTTSTENIPEAERVEVHPNPIQRGQEIIVPPSISRISVSDMHGQTVISTSQRVVPTETWNPGMYILTMEDNQGRQHVQKLMLQ